jgi:antitoxin FitA
MPTTITLKNVPDAVYERLKASARDHRRSINGQAIVCLESALAAGQIPPTEHLSRARALRATLTTCTFRARDTDALKRQGRRQAPPIRQ